MIHIAIKPLICVFLIFYGGGYKGECSQTSKNEDFLMFIKNFQRDSLFRDERVIFPLKGYNSDDDRLTGEDESADKIISYYWDKERWKEYARIQYSGKEYKSKIKRMNTIVKYTLYIENSGFEIISKFKLINGKWYLVSYLYQNI